MQSPTDNREQVVPRKSVGILRWSDGTLALILPRCCPTDGVHSRQRIAITAIVISTIFAAIQVFK